MPAEPTEEGQHILKEVARLCTLDIGKEVLPGDVYGFLNFDDYDPEHTRFTTEERQDIWATMVKEFARLLL